MTSYFSPVRFVYMLVPEHCYLVQKLLQLFDKNTILCYYIDQLLLQKSDIEQRERGTSDGNVQ
jgi:hypothetical protein